ncbi:argininosuccinate lyase [Calorimonas adulescens]|uniref:Argininosuccinate lyase n=1 Tax=Calorimonas adulescens TaxID=2606906 RepID=A0A5D8QBX8_9THEO|nr:argininosuccinate lyase [Calorimonas adulescens]TZE82120.1 argininosuccinate lyase [Calorimonas adulescens]
MKLWGGRFIKEEDRLMEEFNSSINFDIRLFKEDIEGSIGQAYALKKAGILGEDELNKVICSLNEIYKEFEFGKIKVDNSYEDVHSLVESLLYERIGDTAYKLHTGRSRNDQVATDMVMYVKKEIRVISAQLISLLEAIMDNARKYEDIILPGYTHLQRAQPILLAHYFMAYFEMFKRDYMRFKDTLERIDIMPLGSGALAGSTFPLDREYEAEVLGFKDISLNSMDAVSNRDFCLETIFNCALTMMHMSRISEELVLWCTKEFNFIEIDEAYSTGSSMMPQKKNPDSLELVRGKTGRVYGDLMSLLTTMKGLPLAYNKDMQEDKEPTFDAVDTVKMCISILERVISTIKVNGENMFMACKEGYLNATDMADYLAEKGIPFRMAHGIVGNVIRYCEEKGKALDELSLEELKEFSDVFSDDVYIAIDIGNSINRKLTIGSTSREMVEEAMKIEEEWLKVERNMFIV